MTQIINTFTEISDYYDAVFCDLWGCLHNGIWPFTDAVKALEAFSAKGGSVLLLTNSPRPSPSVILQLDQIGVARDLYQGCASSGDAARAALASGAFGQKVFALGPDRDAAFYQDFDTEDFYQGIEIERVPFDQAEGIVCTGLFDDISETPEDYNAMFLAAKTRGLKMLCANPDIVVDRGDQRIYCAGALAEAYAEMGGDVYYFGKPHAPIYALAYNRLTAIAGREVSKEKIICIGDGIMTDIRGAVGEDIDSLFITGGLAAQDTGTMGQPDPARLNIFLQTAQLTPTYSIGHLR